jgi:hypothetical protein
MLKQTPSLLCSGNTCNSANCMCKKIFVLGLIEEHRSDETAAKFRGMVGTTATARQRGERAKNSARFKPDTRAISVERSVPAISLAFLQAR